MQEREKIEQQQASEQTPCSTCFGFGIWAIGLPIPMGPLDAEDGMPTSACPECGVSANPRLEVTQS